MDIDIREIEIRSLRPNSGEVKGLPRNPRKISKKNLEKLKKSVQDAPEMLRLRELIVVPHGGGYVVIAGNQRLEAAKAVGMTALPCKVLPADTDPAKLREYAIKDNLPFGEDDWEVIANDWNTAELELWGMSVPEKWKDNPTAEEDDFDADSVKECVCKKGDIWHLGDHRLMCGDSTNEDDFSKLIGEELADMVFTDPPYGVSIGDKNATLNSVQKAGCCCENIANDTMPSDKLYEVLVKAMSNLRKFSKNDASYYVTSPQGGELGMMMMMMMKDAGLPVRLANCLKDCSKEGDIVLDAFGGSGTTLIAAEQLGRKCYMMELDPHYCDVIIARWEKLTGKKATKIN